MGIVFTIKKMKRKTITLFLPLSKSGSKSTGSVFVLFSMQRSLTAKENVAYQQLNHAVLHVATSHHASSALTEKTFQTHIGLAAVALTSLVVYSHACAQHIFLTH